MKVKLLFRISALVIYLAFPALARADDTRVKVARLDGAPVFHWRTFKSSYADDIDRAVVLREFQRRGFHLPERFVDEALKLEVARHYGGDENKLQEHLRREGASVRDYRRFLAEELILTALPLQIAQHFQGFSRVQWIASLRKRAKIERLR
jgi:hypothetical protein